MILLILAGNYQLQVNHQLQIATILQTKWELPSDLRTYIISLEEAWSLFIATYRVQWVVAHLTHLVMHWFVQSLIPTAAATWR